MIKEILYTEWKAFISNKLQAGFLLLLLLTGGYAIRYGYKEVKKQQAVIRLVQTEEKKQWDGLLKGLTADTTTPAGKRAWQTVGDPRFSWAWHRYNTIFHPAPLAALAIGQRDLFPYYHKLTSHSLYMQVFKNEMVNPQKLLTGNLDLSFVLIFLFPLLVIALGYNIVSAEQENGTYALLKTQPVAFSKILLVKTAFRFVLVAGAALLLSIAGFLYTDAWYMNGRNIAWWLAAVVLYCLFWQGLVYWIASFMKNSAFNAMLLLAVWLLLLVVFPSLLNATGTYRYPINQTQLSNAIRRIQLDESKEALLKMAQAFYTIHPEWSDGDTSFLNLYKRAYPMAGELGDAKASPSVTAYYQQIRNRDQWVNAFNSLSPAVNTQQVLNYLSGTDVNNYLDYQQAVTTFHQQLVKFYHEPLYQHRFFVTKDYAQRPAFSWQPSTNEKTIGKGLLILIVWIVVLFGYGYWIYRRFD